MLRKQEVQTIMLSLWTAPPMVVMKRLILRFIHLFRLTFFFLSDSFILRYRPQQIPRTLLLIKLEGIGDYLLFRNFIEEIKRHSRFSQYAITLCGNTAFKNLAETFDTTVVADFIWIQPKKFVSSPMYRWAILSSIRKRGFEVVVYPTYSRDSLLGDSLVRCAGAKERIGTDGDDVHAKQWERTLFNRYYTRLLPTPDSCVFEFLRNKFFVEHWLSKPLQLPKPFLPTRETIPLHKDPYAVLCPDAQLAKKRWHIHHFRDIAIYLFHKHQLRSVFVGGSSSTIRRGEQDVKELPFVLWRVGQTSLVETVQLIEDASLVVSNDTAVSHIGVALNKPVIVISNGEHYGRFTYPPEVYSAIFYAFPPMIAHSHVPYEELVKKFKYGSFLNINTVRLDDVIPLIEKALKSHKEHS